MMPIYTKSTWTDYASAHQSCLSSAQVTLYKHIAKNVKGNVVDYGCGSGRMAAFISRNSNVSQYTGVDSCKEMIDAARWLALQLHLTNSTFIHREIKFSMQRSFDYAISINSFYTWAMPLNNLEVIYKSLAKEGIFILATPNPELSMRSLVEAADVELVGHPMYPTFRNTNLDLASNTSANFIHMNELIALSTSVGFKVEKCNQKYYQGGMNYLVLST